MPAKSKAQLRMMAAACSGKSTKSGISKKTACEYVHSTRNARRLPERKRRG